MADEQVKVITVVEIDQLRQSVERLLELVHQLMSPQADLTIDSDLGDGYSIREA